MVVVPVSPPVIPAHYAEVILYWFRFEDTYLVVVVIGAFLRKEHLDAVGAPDTWFHLQCGVRIRIMEGLNT